MNYEYYINLDERGEFYADVRDADGRTVFEIGGENGYPLAEIVTDGYMDHGRDVCGLADYLRDVGILPAGASLVLA